MKRIKLLAAKAVRMGLLAMCVSAHGGVLTNYFEDFNSSGEPAEPSGFTWIYDCRERGWGTGDSASIWNLLVPGDGNAHIEVASAGHNDDNKYQALVFGNVDPGHRMEMRAKNLPCPGFTGFIFTYMQSSQEFSLDEIDIEITASDDALPPHAMFPPAGWSDGRFNSWANSSTANYRPVDGTTKGLVDENGNNVSHRDNQYHTYTIDWINFGGLEGGENGRIRFYIDGVFQHEITSLSPDSASNVILGYRDMTWAGPDDPIGWSGLHTCLIDWLAIHTIDEDSPAAKIDRYYTNTDSPSLSVSWVKGVLANDTHTQGTMSAELVSTTEHGSLVLNADGSFTYTPDPGFTGLDQFVYRVNDGTTNGFSNSSVVYITVSQVFSTYILAGQSNAEGYGITRNPPNGLVPNDTLADIGRTDLLDIANTNLQCYQGANDYNEKNYLPPRDEWHTLADEEGYGGNGERFGPELSFAKEMENLLWEKIAIVKYARSSASLSSLNSVQTGGVWNDFDPSDSRLNQYDKLIETITGAVEGAKTSFWELRIDGILWMQGESDLSNNEANAYEANLTEFIAALRTDLQTLAGNNEGTLSTSAVSWDEANVLVGTIGGTGNADDVRAAQAAVAAADEHVTTVNGTTGISFFTNDDFGYSGLHYDTAGQVLLGERFAAAAEPRYSVTYSGNGEDSGSPPVDGNNYPEAHEATVLGNTGGLAKSGLAFAGWNTQADGSGITYGTGATLVMSGSNVILYAVWSSDATYALTVTGGAGDGSYLAGAQVGITAAIPGGKRFLNWTTADGGSFADANAAVTTYTMPPQAATLVAHFEDIPYFTVTYDDNGSSSGTVPVDSNFYEENDIVLIYGNTGYLQHSNLTFAGWNTQPDGGGTDYASASSLSMPGSNVTLYAKWILIDKTVMFGNILNPQSSSAIGTATINNDTWNSIQFNNTEPVVDIPATVLVDSDGDASGYSFAANMNVVSANPYQLQSVTAQGVSTDPEWNWYHHAVADTASVGKGSAIARQTRDASPSEVFAAYTFSGFDPADSVTLDFVLSTDKNTVRYRTKVTVDGVDFGEFGELGVSEYEFTASSLTGKTAYIVEFLNSNTSQYMMPPIGNAFRLTVEHPPSGGNDPVDTDNDGLPDWWEIMYGLNHTNGMDAAWDKDSDGMVNSNEYIAGTNPDDDGSLFVITEADPVSNVFQLGWVSASNRIYSILESSNLVDWVTISSNIPASPPENREDVPSTNRTSFFQIEVEMD